MRRIKYLVAALVMSGFVSCELDRYPETSLSDASFWSTEKDLQDACNYLYTLLPGVVFDDNRSDDTFGTQPNSTSDGSWIVPNSDNSWSDPYKMIRAANNILEKSVDVPASSAKNRFLGEARFFRAWAYFNLVSKYGDVPLLLKTVDYNGAELTSPKTSREVVLDSLYADLDYAFQVLPTFIELGNTGYGRVSKSAAYSLKARAALFEGTRQKFHNYGNSSKHLDLAIAAASAVMAQGHSLYNGKGADSYNYLFRYEGEGFSNKENILVRIYGDNITNEISSHTIARNLEQGFRSATRSLVESYLCVDGLPMNISPLAVSETKSTSIFENKDPRLQASVFKLGNVFINGNPFIPSIRFAKTGYTCRKFWDEKDWLDNKSFIDMPLIRYAEVLLIFAEAKFEKDGTISDSDLDKSINVIRRRVNMPNLTNAFVSGNGLDMRTELRRERRVELAQEGFRYEDILRWKTAENLLPQPILGAKFIASEYTDVANPAVNEDGLFLVQPSSKRTFDAKKDYLYPIPVREIGLSNGNVVQNPGW